jgi:hypothetical protein
MQGWRGGVQNPVFAYAARGPKLRMGSSGLMLGPIVLKLRPDLGDEPYGAGDPRTTSPRNEG